MCSWILIYSGHIGTCSSKRLFNSLPDDKILDWSRLKAFADNNINVTEKFIFILGRVENNVKKGENAGYQHFPPFPTMFSEGLLYRVVQSHDCVIKSWS